MINVSGLFNKCKIDILLGTFQKHQADKIVVPIRKEIETLELMKSAMQLKTVFSNFTLFDCELRSIAVLRIALLLLLLLLLGWIFISYHHYIAFPSVRCWINNPIFVWNSDEILIFNQQYSRSGLLISSIVGLIVRETWRMFFKEEWDLVLALNSLE